MKIKHICKKPFFYKLDLIEGHDINTIYDFELAKHHSKNINYSFKFTMTLLRMA